MTTPAYVPDQESLLLAYPRVRNHSTALCAPLETEDYVVQPVSDVSPPKWHLAHTTWFFEELLLVAYLPGYTRFDAGFRTLFNSYYKAAGEHWLQSERGQLSRPTVREVMAYRAAVDDAVMALLATGPLPADALRTLEIGLQHEQQHQELLLMDIKYILGANPGMPVYSNTNPELAEPCEESWQQLTAGTRSIGHSGEAFGFDNEFPRHTTYLPDARIRNQLVSNGEFLAFMTDGGYDNPQYWLSLGWDWVQEHGAGHPLYWLRREERWSEFTLYGAQALDPELPVSHINYFEAQAYAAWAGARLPTEQELELYLLSCAEPAADGDEPGVHASNRLVAGQQLWCWTSSGYAPYPGYRPYEGMLGEYNGKFMCGQYVLRGGCVATPPGHYRPTYRNFYLPHQQWMFSGICLAKDNT